MSGSSSIARIKTTGLCNASVHQWEITRARARYKEFGNGLVVG
jgi:hypothetical protein